MSTKRLPSIEQIREGVVAEYEGRNFADYYGPIPMEASRFADNCPQHCIPERMQSGGLSDSPKPRPQSILQSDKPARFTR